MQKERVVCGGVVCGRSSGFIVCMWNTQKHYYEYCSPKILPTPTHMIDTKHLQTMTHLAHHQIWPYISQGSDMNLIVEMKISLMNK